MRPALRVLIRSRQIHTSTCLANTPRPAGGRFSAYTARLAAVSSRTGVSLPSLALSFGILHELTALVPLVILFFTFQAADVGTSVVAWAGRVSDEAPGEARWRGVVSDWLAEGERRVDRVARTYGLFGYPRGGGDGDEKGVNAGEEARQLVAVAGKGSKAAADVTNAIAAYVFVKVSFTSSGRMSSLTNLRSGQALLPARIGVSLAFAPAFSRRVVNPTRRFVWHGILRRPKS